jgi:hypothetical protein
MLGSLVFVFLLEAIFMVGIIVALVTVSFFMFTLLFPLHPDQNVVLTFSLSYIVFLAIATPAMLGWRRLVTNKEERIMSFALVLSFLSIAFPFIPLAWNLYYFEFLLSTVVSTWPVITLTGALLLVLSFHALHTTQDAPVGKQFRILRLLLSLVVFLATIEVIPTLISWGGYPIAMTMSPFWAITHMGAFAVLLEAILQFYRTQTPIEQPDPF